jgi:putative iron-only hydrogenase system regulator
MSRRIGVVSIIVTDRSAQAPRVNAIISEFGDIVIGRMGLPYRARGVHIIALILDGTNEEVGALTGRLGTLQGVTVKASLMKG